MINPIILEMLLIIGIFLAMVPVHELGHVLAFKYYGVPSRVRFKSGWKAAFVCDPISPETYIISVLRSTERSVVVSAGGGVSVLVCLCIYVLYPVVMVLFIAMFGLAYTLWEIAYIDLKRREFFSEFSDEIWFLESIEENRYFMEEIKKYPNRDITVPYIRMLLRADGFDLSDWK